MKPSFSSVVEDVLQQRFRGVLSAGSHAPGGTVCLLELAHAACGDPWSDKPDRWPDLRALNDGVWSSDALRTTHLLPVLAAYWEWEDWLPARRQACVERIVLDTVRTLIAALPGLPTTVRTQCRHVQTVEDAEAPARSSAMTRRSATAAARAAAEAARAAAGAEAVDGVLIQACTVWIESARPGSDTEERQYRA